MRGNSLGFRSWVEHFLLDGATHLFRACVSVPGFCSCLSAVASYCRAFTLPGSTLLVWCSETLGKNKHMHTCLQSSLTVSSISKAPSLACRGRVRCSHSIVPLKPASQQVTVDAGECCVFMSLSGVSAQCCLCVHGAFPVLTLSLPQTSSASSFFPIHPCLCHPRFEFLSGF